MINVSGTLMKNSRANDPMIFSEQMKMFSGPWCASSDTSNKSVTRRLIISPVLFLS